MSPDGEDWRAKSACANTDPEIFFPPQGESTAPAKRICAGCPVLDQCRQFGLYESEGVFGGLSPRQRREYRAVNQIPKRVRPPKTECTKGHNLLAPGAVRRTTRNRLTCVECERARKETRGKVA